MSIKTILFSLIVVERLIKIIKYVVQWQYRFKPLPQEVADIYDSERYDTYIRYHKEYVPIFVANIVIGCIWDILIIFGGFLPWIEGLSNGNEYLIYFLTIGSMVVLDHLSKLPFDYYDTFFIEEKYGLNKKSKKEFFKDYFLENIFELLVMSIFGLMIIFICESLGAWTNDFNVSYKKSVLLVGGIMTVVGLVIVALQVLSLKMMRMKYQFTELEAGPLRSQIEDLMNDSKKKVKHIKVYNESKKSNCKNAFLLRLLWYREFGIADNFMIENSERELLAVLSHEVGHLKHQKNIFNYIQYFFNFSMAILLVWLIPNAPFIITWTQRVNQDFGLQHTNYYLMIALFSSMYYFVNIFISMFQNYKSRQEELEADLNAVKNGYGEELIETFKKVSTDELIDINPAPLIEFLDYSHPGMYQRIVYIKNAMKEMESFKSEK